jgi:hypothetical protein
VRAESLNSAGRGGVHAKTKAMAYTVKQVAAMSGISVRTLHFYGETALLKPAYTKANGYRIYKEPQLLMLEFFQALAKFKDLPTREQAINKTYTEEQKIAMVRLFEAHGMIVTGPPLGLE